jgi:hypothetical protein
VEGLDRRRIRGNGFVLRGIDRQGSDQSYVKAARLSLRFEGPAPAFRCTSIHRDTGGRQYEAHFEGWWNPERFAINAPQARKTGNYFALQFQRAPLATSEQLFTVPGLRAVRPCFTSTVSLDHQGLLPSFALITEGRVRESRVARSLRFEPGTIVVFDRGCSGWPSGGGYGNSVNRDAEPVLADVLDGLLSVNQARADYGVIVSQGALDAEATALCRSESNFVGRQSIGPKSELRAQCMPFRSLTRWRRKACDFSYRRGSPGRRLPRGV